MILCVIYKQEMAMPLPREWVGIQQFPVATQNKLVELLGKLKGEVSIPLPAPSLLLALPSYGIKLYLV
jgi:hypothetical protein